MTDTQKNNQLHGITLKTILTELLEQYGWEELGKKIDIRCFKIDPSISSSLKFLRKTLSWTPSVGQKRYRLKRESCQLSFH